ncbi:hypothetical protein CspeluHIS016_0800070 [Cutaneotrichosporon spelunceum]|uniref:Uncharacterized protein n=1 Tax=Cutaneotrichosporon spelunceum TaxID=1672016 RepID=A0AAD3TZG6_9TREE|nr:hypothetical protein CspeluHIS016_0800070 [Cutaneotrichosporon spelunceum]
MRPTKYSPPLPRMKPQPQNIGAMFAHRQRKREQRILRIRETLELRDEIAHEVRLWRSLGLEDEWSAGLEGEDRRDAGWSTPLIAQVKSLEGMLYADVERAHAVFSPEVMERVKGARRRREVWRLNKARKARGEEPVFPERSKDEETLRAVKRAQREERLAEHKGQ